MYLENEKYNQWYLTLQKQVEPVKKRVKLNMVVYCLEENEVIIGMKQLSKMFSTGIKSVNLFISLCETNNLLKKRVIGVGNQRKMVLELTEGGTKGNADEQRATEYKINKYHNKGEQRGTLMDTDLQSKLVKNKEKSTTERGTKGNADEQRAVELILQFLDLKGEQRGTLIDVDLQSILSEYINREVKKRGTKGNADKQRDIEVLKNKEKSLIGILSKSTVKLLQNHSDIVNNNLKSWLEQTIEPKKQESKELQIEKFLNWFNNQKQKRFNKESKYRVLTNTDWNNLKTLKKSYNEEDFKIALKNLFVADWALKNNMINPSHFLRVENFNKYLNEEERGAKTDLEKHAKKVDKNAIENQSKKTDLSNITPPTIS